MLSFLECKQKKQSQLKALEHIAIIMDGNRRWAKKKGIPSNLGHWKGAEKIDEIVESCVEFNIKVLTLFAFSTENWGRDSVEIEALFELFYHYLDTKKQHLIRKGIRLSWIGNTESFPGFLKNKLEEVAQATSEGQSLDLVLALNYGARDEITRAVIKIMESFEQKKIQKQEVTEKLISSYLDTFRWKDPDLLIRTSGEKRLSNFLLWQLSYTEVYVTDVLWPEFGRDELQKAIDDFHVRQRRFGE